jgi:hypothetical protein
MTTQLFAQQRDDGTVDATGVVKKRAIQCALSRICGSCGQPLTWPVTFVGSAEEAADLMFAFPPLHPSCAVDLLRDAADERVMVRTGGFDLVRPTRRGEPVLFRPNSVIEED